MKPDITFPVAPDMEHALATFGTCSCGAVLPDSELAECSQCGARQCGQCDCQCACDEIKLIVIDSISDGAVWLTEWCRAEN